MRMFRVHCAVLNTRPATSRLKHVHRVTAAMARGKRPDTFRTRKLSLSAPMVLPPGPVGRVGRRRTAIPEGAPPARWGPFVIPDKRPCERARLFGWAAIQRRDSFVVA